jgi:hypothetical protein
MVGTRTAIGLFKLQRQLRTASGIALTVDNRVATGSAQRDRRASGRYRHDFSATKALGAYVAKIVAPLAINPFSIVLRNLKNAGSVVLIA